MPNLSLRPLSAQALTKLLDRKPHLLRPLAAQLLPPPLAATDPAEHLGIDLSSLRTTGEALQVLATVLAAIAGGEITPAGGARIARRVRNRLRAIRRLARPARERESRAEAGHRAYMRVAPRTKLLRSRRTEAVLE